MTRALITGGAGFIGLHLARHLLSHGVEVALLDNFARGRKDGELDAVLEDKRASLVTAELRHGQTPPGLGTDFDVIYHLAARVGVANVAEAPYEVLSDNVAMTLGAIELARRQRNLARIVFASSSEVYAAAAAQGQLAFPTPETAPLVAPPLENPRSAYALSKIYGEALCHQSGLPFTIIRPHNVYGPRMGMAHVIPELLKRAWETPSGGEFPVFSVDHSRTFCFIDDAVEAIRRAAEHPAGAGLTLNVGSDTPEVAIGELAKLVLETVGKELNIVARPATQGSPRRRCPDIGAIETLTGHRPAISLADGLARTFDWYRADGFGDPKPAENKT